MRLNTSLRLTAIAIALSLLAEAALAAEPAKRLRAGMIGLDTSHVVEFVNLLNSPKAKGELAEMTVVAAYPGGSPDLPISWNRVKGFTNTLRNKGVKIVASIPQLLDQVDVVLLESVDGRPHLAQARPVIAAGKPLFIDKPMAASLADAIQIFRLAKAKHVLCFSASSLRFDSGPQDVRQGTAGFGAVRGCVAWCPAGGAPTQPEPFWFHGIHGVELLFTIMGPGCQSVSQAVPERVVGHWKGGRQGVFVANNRGARKPAYGATVEGTERSGDASMSESYAPLLVAIVKSFKSGKSPVDPAETLEIMAFMEAADQSRQQGGVPVSIESVMKQAEEQIAAEGGR
jgi:hypothetical protein